jgi:hypothetical protein
MVKAPRMRGSSLVVTLDQTILAMPSSQLPCRFVVVGARSGCA